LEVGENVHAIATELIKRGDLTGEEIEELYVNLYGEKRPVFQDTPIQYDFAASQLQAAPAKEIEQ
jgi:cell division protease FtsH